MTQLMSIAFPLGEYLTALLNRFDNTDVILSRSALTITGPERLKAKRWLVAARFISLITSSIRPSISKASFSIMILLDSRRDIFKNPLIMADIFLACLLAF